MLLYVIVVIHVDFALESLEISNVLALVIDAFAFEDADKHHSQRIDVSSVVIVLPFVDPIIHVGWRTYS